MLELKNIHFSTIDENTNQTKTIINDINLDIEDNTFVVITGPNGGGKSTLAKIIIGMETPTRGNILFNGEDITSLTITERTKRGLGFAFQQPVRFKGLYARDLLRLASGKTLTTEEACEYLSQVGLCASEYVDRELNASLSGGELKRIEIAMLMARKAKLSIFDEPEAGIDLWSFQNLVQVFEQLRDETKGAIMIISHQERILEIADKIVVIADGKITGQGSKEEILPKLLVDSDLCEFYKRRT